MNRFSHAFPSHYTFATYALHVFTCILLFSICQQPFAHAQVVTNKPANTLPVAEDTFLWDTAAYPTFSKDSVGNIGQWLFHKPAGSKGAITPQPDGSLAFADGTPARFWGTTTCFGMTFPEKESEIAKLADGIAARGYNAVRFHHNDIASVGLGFLQAKPKSNHKLDPVGMDRLDKFVAALIERGIYIYIDLIDYRTILEEDGIYDVFPDMKKFKQNHGWKGLFPHPVVVNAWKRFVTNFMNHVNPYTGRAYKDEPAVINVEILNENGAFWDWSFQVSDSVQTWYDQSWNTWLAQTYGTRDKLAQAWTNGAGETGLFDDEDPNKGTVFRPRISKDLNWDRPHRSRSRGVSRVNDYFRFLSESNIAFFKEAKAHLRSLGYKGIMTGSHEIRGPIDRYGLATVGAVGSHLYAPSAPAWGARPGKNGITVSGVDVTAYNWYSNIPRIKVAGVPAINGEWTGGDITRRADVNSAVGIATAFQGVSQSLHFSYGHRWRGRQQPRHDDSFDYIAWRKAIWRSFNSANDIPWMMANRFVSPLFIRGDFAKPRYTVHLAFSTQDLNEQSPHGLGKIGGSGTIGGAANFLPLIHNTESFFFDTQCDSQADVVFSTGRTASGDYSKVKHGVILGDNPWTDAHHKTRDLGAPAKAIHPTLTISTIKEELSFNMGELWEGKTITSSDTEGVIHTASLPPDASPIGLTADKRYTLGWLDKRFLVLPNARLLDTHLGDARWLFRLYLSATAHWGMDLKGNSADASHYISDTGELTSDWGFGVHQVDTPKSQGFSGFVGWRPNNITSKLTVDVKQPYANVFAVSTDDNPIHTSSALLVIATGRNKNTGQKLGIDKNGKLNVIKTGKAPMYLEGLRGTLTLRHDNAKGLFVYAMDKTGTPVGTVPHTVDGNALSFALSPAWKSTWFEVSTTARDVPMLTNPQSPTPNYPVATTTTTTKYLALLSKQSTSKPKKMSVDGLNTLWSFEASKAPSGAYGNAILTKVSDPQHKAVGRLQFGKKNREWFGGFWYNFPSQKHLDPKSVVGITFLLKGDGTQPRDFFINMNCQGTKYRSANLNQLFENDQWEEKTFFAEQFTLDEKWAKKNPDKAKQLPKHPNLTNLTRLDINCVGPLMDAKSVLFISKAGLTLKGDPNASARDAKDILPKAAPLPTRTFTIPSVSDVPTIDGDPGDKVWHNAIGISIDESNVPEWHFFGSHIISGNRDKGQAGQFHLMGTPKGLAVLVSVDKGGDDIVANKKDWWLNDCVEIFTNVKADIGKPTKQIFLAHTKPGTSGAQCSAPGASIHRLNTKQGYILEALIPWTELGFNAVPTTPFGIELQISSLSATTGQKLQMALGTGTNEAYIHSKYYPIATLKAP